MSAHSIGDAMHEDEILELISRDRWMMAVLRTAADLNLPDWMIGSGFLRNKVWDHLHGISRPVVDTADIDLIYFDAADLSEATEKQYDAALGSQLDVPWSAKNQARMHPENNDAPYTSTEHALANWVETATAVAVTICDGRLALIAPYGIGDLVNLILRPTPLFAHPSCVNTFHERVAAKQWLTKWPKLRVVA